MSPRRSSRARATQPAPGPQPQHSSTASSTSSARGERNTRSNIKQDGPLTSATPRSLSSEEAEGQEATELDSRRTRQDLKAENNLDEDDIEDEGVTRCVCRQQDYPGPPVSLPENSRSHHAKDSNAPTAASGENLSEEAGGLFIQCDICQVWQHGGCVGIMDEAMSPENYYCEECRKDLHRVMIGARGQRYSRYLPVYNNTQVTSPRKYSGSKDPEPRSSREVDGKAASSSAAAQNAKRRSTMNSRAAYDEEEVMRRVLEESKTEGPNGSSVNGGRKGKRGRDDSEDASQEAKRRKTSSETPGPADGLEEAELDSDNNGSGRRASSSRKRVRGDAAQLQREKELRERELEKEKERAEAAGRRKGRAERRRVDESEPPEDAPRVTSSTKTGGSQPRSTKSQAPRTATESSLPNTSSASHKKNGRPARRGRLGRNQYTTDRDMAADSAMQSPHASQSRDEEELGHGEHEDQSGQVNGNGSKPSKPRLMNPNRTSMNDMKRRVAGILEYISRTQIEMAAEKAANGGSSGSSTAKPNGRAVPNGASKLSHEINGGEEEAEKNDDDEKVAVDEDGFKKLNSLDMMDVLTRELVHWQKDHGKWR